MPALAASLAMFVLTPPPVVSSAKGYAVARWTAGGMAYVAASDINPADLQDFARLRAAPQGGSVLLG